MARAPDHTSRGRYQVSPDGILQHWIQMSHFHRLPVTFFRVHEGHSSIAVPTQAVYDLQVQIGSHASRRPQPLTGLVAGERVSAFRKL